MYKYEISAEPKVLLLRVHGTQDGWEAKLMHIEWPDRAASMDGDWTLVVDLSDYVTPQPPALREQEKLGRMLAAAKARTKLAISSGSEELDRPFLGPGDYDFVADFDEAWTKVGGLPRDRKLAPPEDGTRYEANNPPPVPS
jgi:hypothetical protein